MPRSRSEMIADAIAKKIMANTRKRWRTLHADALQEIRMSEVTKQSDATLPHMTSKGSPADAQKMPGSPSSDSVTSGMTVGSQVNVGAIKPVDRKTIEGSYPGDSRSEDETDITAQFKNQAGPRSETNDSENPGA
jgi:hypothetical protein